MATSRVQVEFQHDYIVGDNDSKILNTELPCRVAQCEETASQHPEMSEPFTPRTLSSEYSLRAVLTSAGMVLPPTPDYTPDKERKRSFPTVSDDFLVCPSSPTERRSAVIKKKAPRRIGRRGPVPSFSIMHRRSGQKEPRLAADELRRVCESVLSQIDWEEVVEYTASNRKPGVYRSAIKGILQKQVSKQFRQEEQCDSSE